MHCSGRFNFSRKISTKFKRRIYNEIRLSFSHDLPRTDLRQSLQSWHNFFPVKKDCEKNKLSRHNEYGDTRNRRQRNRDNL